MTTEEAIEHISSWAECKYKPTHDAACLAIAALRAQAESERNEPLTLDELREMDGEPVWVCPPSLEDGMAWALADGKWALVDVKYDMCRTSGGGLGIIRK